MSPAVAATAHYMIATVPLSSLIGHSALSVKYCSLSGPLGQANVTTLPLDPIQRPELVAAVMSELDKLTLTHVPDLWQKTH
jgi:hypothetical protein